MSMPVSDAEEWLGKICRLKVDRARPEPAPHKPLFLRDSSLISTSVRMAHPQRTSDEKRPGRDRQKINPREFATTGPRTPETAANYLLHRGLRQDGGGDQRGVSLTLSSYSLYKAHDDAPTSKSRMMSKIKIRIKNHGQLDSLREISW